MSGRIVLGTRGSDLALAQAHIVRSLLLRKQPGLEVLTHIIKTTGDERLDVSLSSPGALDKGLFTKEIEEALVRGEIDIAVHSLKDLPIDQPSGLCLGAILERGDPRDALVSKIMGGIDALPPGGTVATSSPRRKHQLLAIRPDLHVVEIRGNVPTRLQKLLGSPSIDGLLLAKAGLDRLGARFVPMGLHISVEERILPAPGQGAIAVECRASDKRVLAFLSTIHHEPTARCAAAERELLRSHGGGCHLPFAALATIRDGELIVRSFFPG